MAARLLFCVGVAAALRLPSKPAPPPATLSARPSAPSLGALPSSPRAAAAALAALVPAAAHADIDWNAPPIELNPFSINPSGYIFIGGYIAYLGWSILRPPSEAELKYRDKTNAEMEASAKGGVPFYNAAREAEGAVVTASGLVYQELSPGTGASPGKDDKARIG